MGRILSCPGCRGLSSQHYNVLRILYVRDQAGEGIPVGDIRGLLLVSVPDVTRLIDRQVKAGLVERDRDPGDRRVVKVRVTAAGVDKVDAIHRPLVDHNCELLSPMSKAEIKELARLTTKALSLLT